jgi:hypothetical protein
MCIRDRCEEDARKQAILDQVENQMRQENLFFWPLSIYPYAVGDVSDGQYPFPVYENGDLFLSWGSVGIDAYACYKPDLALKYVENILAKYKKDGLAFQRYLRYGQQGAGDDILSGNALSIIGLYKSIYGINPRYNRLYLAPHLPAKLNGTMLLYHHRGEKLSIELNANRYSIGNGQFSLTASSDFGFDGQNDLLSFFQGENDEPALRFTSRKGEKMSVEILKCSDKERIWKQSGNHSKVECIASRLIPGTNYVLSYGEKNIQVKTDSRGDVHLKLPSCPTNSEIRLTVSGS